MPKIMVVDDSTSERSLLARLLRNEGHQVVLAGGGEEALQLLHSTNPELVVLDVAMPDLDGLQVLEILHDDPRWRNVPVIMLTGISDTLSIQRAEQLGAREYVVKAAFSISQMLAIINKHVPPRPSLGV
jgi:adenylate cyclase